MADVWRESTTAFDRVKSVALTLSDPHTVAWIAEEAAVSENTARNHLERLAELGVLATLQTEDGIAYYPDPIYTRSQDLRELVADRTEDELGSRAVELQEEIEEYRDRYHVETPAALRASVAGADLDAETARTRLEDASDWAYARYRLALVRDALEHYDTYRPPSRFASA